MTLTIRSLLLAAALCGLNPMAVAQNAAPKCYTPRGWCMAPHPGPPGARCACPAPSGWISGTLGY